MELNKRNVLTPKLQTKPDKELLRKAKKQKVKKTLLLLISVIVILSVGVIVCYNYITGRLDDANDVSKNENIAFIDSVNGVKFNMIKIEGGTFNRDVKAKKQKSKNSNRQESINVTSFCIGQTEVTQELWQAVMGANPSFFKEDKCPVENVSWYEAIAFCEKLSQITGRKYYLPTMSQWQFAAMGGMKSQGFKYSGSPNIGDVAWLSNNSGGKTHIVAEKKPKELGIYDMSGNVWEWCSDVRTSGVKKDSIGVYCGGAWVIGDKYSQVSSKTECRLEYKGNIVGFRIACDK